MAEAKLSVRHFQQCLKKGKKIVCLTGYDSLMAKMIDESGVDMILVGDSLGMTMLGYKSTIPVTLEQSLHHTAAVVRSVQRAFVVGDMPFMTYQINPDEALRNAGRYLQEAGADAVKLEGGQEMAPTVERMVQSGIPVLGHIGLMPQHLPAEGRYRTFGRNSDEAAKMMADALALQKAGAFGIVLEGTIAGVAKDITEKLDIPTIGIGAGAHCSGQVQVSHDILGMFESFVPKHTRRYAKLAEEMRRVFTEFINDVENGKFPGDDETFK